MTAKIYTDDKGRLVFQGFTCKDGIVSGGDNLRNDLFLAFLKFAYKNMDNIPAIGVLDCKFYGDDWMSRIMTRISGGQVANHSKSSNSDSPSETPPATS